MFDLTRFFLCAGFAAALAAPLSADPRPQPASPADPQTIANAVAGTTYLWKSCKGGVYFGGQWQAQAWCNRTGPSVGIGTWSVDRKGKVCLDLTWYWPKGDGVGSKDEPVTDRNCDEHLVDASGTIWRSWGGDADWWQFETNKNRVKGFKFKRNITRLRKKLGV